MFFDSDVGQVISQEKLTNPQKHKLEEPNFSVDLEFKTTSIVCPWALPIIQ